jgi:hypothetical protein
MDQLDPNHLVRRAFLFKKLFVAMTELLDQFEGGDDVLGGKVVPAMELHLLTSYRGMSCRGCTYILLSF